MSKHKKIALPCDRTGAPIHIGDVLEWGDGERMMVRYLTYYGDGFWTADEDSGDGSDNLSASLVVWSGGKK